MHILNKTLFSSVRLLAVDLDGTLLPRSKQVTSRALRALEACRRRGILLAVVTGRAERSAVSYLEELQPDAAVLSYGAQIMIRGKTVYRRYISADTANRILRRAEGAHCLRCQTEDGVRYIRGREEANCLPLEGHGPFSLRMDHICAWDLPEETARQIAREERCSLSQLIGSRWCNFAPYGCNKGTGTRRAFAALGLEPGTGLAFGNEDCDLGFFRVCGIGVATRNSDEATLAGADFVTESCEEDGVAAFLERYILD